MQDGAAWGRSQIWVEENDDVRLVLIIVVLLAAAVAGLYIYGQMMEPETRTIEQEALNVAR